MRFRIGDADGLDPIIVARNGTDNAPRPRVGGPGDGDINHFANDQGVHPGCKMGMEKLSWNGEILVRQFHSDALSLINRRLPYRDRALLYGHDAVILVLVYDATPGKEVIERELLARYLLQGMDKEASPGVQHMLDFG